MTIPAGTLKASPQVSNLTMPPARVVERVEITVPPGPRGDVGFQVAQGSVQLYPYETGNFIVVDGVELDWDVVGGVDSGAWQLIAYNTGAFNHTLQVRFLTHLAIAPSEPASFTPLPVDALQSA